MRLIIWDLLFVLWISSGDVRTIMDSELHYASKDHKATTPLTSEYDFPSSMVSPLSSPRTNPGLFIQHFYFKRSSILSSPSDNRFFYDQTHKFVHKSCVQSRMRDILIGSPPPSCGSEEIKNKEGTISLPPVEAQKDPLIVKAVPIEDMQLRKGGQPSSSTSSLENTSDEPLEPKEHPLKGEEEEEDDAFNSTVIEVPKMENKTEDIPSFREWTQKALEKEEKERKETQDKKKQQLQQVLTDQNSTNESLPSLPESKNGSVNLDTAFSSSGSSSGGDAGPSTSPSLPASSSSGSSSTSTLRLKKNYASIDCGAKIVGSNPESTGGNYIISSSRDEYMLNKCSDKIWFVIELCESIKARRIEIANFELYSSVPKEFRVSLSNVYPSREWTHFGTFLAQESRDVQVFDNLADNVFGKYVKVEVLSHHGSEHYCPISLFKIFGISEIELMAHDDEDETHDESPHEPEEDEELTPKSRGKSSIVNFIKEKVDETIGRVVKVVFRGGEAQNDSESSVEKSRLSFGQLMQTPVYTLNCPHCNGTEFQEVAGLMSTELSFLKDLLTTQLDLRAHLLDFACERFGFPSFNTSGRRNSSSSCASGSSLFGLYHSFFGSNRMIALCNIAYFDEKAEMTLRNLSTKENNDKKERDRIEGNSSSCHGSGSGKSSSSGQEKQRRGGVEDDYHPQVAPIASGEESQKEPSHQEIKPTRVESENKDLHSTIPSSSIDSVPNSSPSTYVPNTMPDPPSVVHVPPPASSMAANSVGQEDQEPKAQSTANQRESVWQKLTNRIKSLERNVSFSSGYLEELSVLYKKQIEDLQLSVRQSAESLNSALKSILNEKNERKKLEAQIRELSSNLFILSEKVDSITSWTFGAHVTFIILEILVGCYCIVSTNKQISGQFRGGYSTFSIESSKGNKQRTIAHEEENMQISKENKVEEKGLLLQQKSSTPCKRRHSFDEQQGQGGGQSSSSPLVGNKPRRSLDFSSFKTSTDSSESHVPSLTRRQRRRIQQNQRRKISASSKLKQAPKIRVQNLFSCILPSIETNNMFGSLNSSVHGDPTPIKQLYVENNNNLEPGCSSKQQGSASLQAKNLLRSKSTSPTRKSEAAKQREDFENFDPDEFRNNHSPLPPPV